jgi:hypothetical protein
MLEIKVETNNETITVAAVLKEGNISIISTLTYPSDIYKMPSQIRSDPIMGMAELVTKDVIRIYQLYAN